MIKYYLKVTINPTKSNPHQWPTKVEYYGKRSECLSTYCTPSYSYLMMFGFGSLKAAENEKVRRQVAYDRNDNKFKTFTHEIEILSEEI